MSPCVEDNRSLKEVAERERSLDWKGEEKRNVKLYFVINNVKRASLNIFTQFIKIAKVNLLRISRISGSWTTD